MNVTPDEAEQALDAIQKVTQKTRRSLARSGAYVFLILTGIIWLVGFSATQFLSGEIVIYIWVVLSLVGSAASIPLGNRLGRRVQSPAFPAVVRRIVIFWAMLVVFGVATILVAQPTDSKQVTLFVVLFMMLGQAAMGLLFSYTTTWWALPVALLSLAGYFLLPSYFYLWMAVLVGGGMIALAVYIRLRW